MNQIKTLHWLRSVSVMWLMAVGLTASVQMPVAQAQNAPATGKAWTGWLNIKQDACVARAHRALTDNGLRPIETTSWYVTGEAPGISVGIDCVADDDTNNLVSAQANRVLVKVSVVGLVQHLAILAQWRDRLGEYMRAGQNPNTTGGVGGNTPGGNTPGGNTPGGNTTQNEPLLGLWRGCDGRVVEFKVEGNQIVGRYTALGGLGVFRVGDAGYVARSLGNGRYDGQVQHRWADGRSEWRPNTITINGDQYTDTGSDNCSRQMTRVGGGGAGGGEARAFDLSGKWWTRMGGWWPFHIIFTSTGGGRYTIQHEAGAGLLSGTAVLTGRQLRIDWKITEGLATGSTGRHEIELDATGSPGKGRAIIVGRDGATQTLDAEMHFRGQ